MMESNTVEKWTNKRPYKIVLSKDNIWTLFLVLLTLPHLNPPYLAELGIVGDIVDIWRMMSFVIILLMVLIKQRKLSLISFLLCGIQVYLFVNTIAHKAAVLNFAKEAFSIVSAVILYDFAIRKNKKSFLKSQLFCFELVIYVNLLTEIVYPEGLYLTNSVNTFFVSNKNWFLGYYNNHTQYFLPALLLAFLYKKETGKRLRVYLLTAVIYISVFLVWSGGVVASLGLVAIVYVFFRSKTIIFNYYNYWLIHIFFYVAIILLKIQNLFRWLIDGVLDKWSSLEGRMSLWDITRRYIMEHIWFGYGIEVGIVREIKSGYKWAVHAHNLLLEIMYRGGVVYLLSFVWIVLLVGSRVKMCNNTEVGKIISCAFLGWSIHALVEPYATPFLMAMFVIAYYCKEFAENGKDEVFPNV